MGQTTHEKSGRLGDLELLVRDRPEALVRRLALAPHRKGRGSAGEGWGRFLQVAVFGGLLTLIPWTISGWLLTHTQNAEIWLALFPWVVILGVLRGRRWNPAALRPISHVDDGFLEQHIMSRVAPYLREDSLTSVYTSPHAPGLTAALHGKTLAGGSLTLRFDARATNTRLLLRIADTPVHPVLTEIETIDLPKVHVRNLPCGGVEVDLQGSPQEWWDALPELRRGDVEHDAVAYVTAFLLSRLSLRSRSFDRVLHDLSSLSSVTLTPTPQHADLLSPPNPLQLEWVARTVIPSSNPDEDELEDFLDIGTSVYHRSGVLVLSLALLSHIFVVLLAREHGPAGWFLHAGYWWIALCVVMTAWHQGIADLPYGRVAPYVPQTALDERGSLALDQHTLRNGQGEIDLQEPFTVDFSRDMYHNRPLLNVSIRQSKPDGAMSRVEFSTHVDPDAFWDALPRYAAASPVIAPTEDLQSLWKVLDHYGRAHGQHIPFYIEVREHAEDDNTTPQTRSAPVGHSMTHAVSRTS